MIPVIQSRVHDPENRVTGTCLAAAIASILEVKESAIPLRYLDGYFDGEGENWWDVLNDDLAAHFDLVLVHIPWPDVVEPRDWHVLNGPSPRGEYGHSVVGYRGEFIHDPHPSGAGLAPGWRSYYILRPVEGP